MVSLLVNMTASIFFDFDLNCLAEPLCLLFQEHNDVGTEVQLKRNNNVSTNKEHKKCRSDKNDV